MPVLCQAILENESGWYRLRRFSNVPATFATALHIVSSNLSVKIINPLGRGVIADDSMEHGQWTPSRSTVDSWLSAVGWAHVPWEWHHALRILEYKAICLFFQHQFHSQRMASMLTASAKAAHSVAASLLAHSQIQPGAIIPPTSCLKENAANEAKSLDLSGKNLIVCHLLL